MTDIRKELDQLKRIVEEDLELSDEAKKAVAKARAAPESDYIQL